MHPETKKLTRKTCPI